MAYHNLEQVYMYEPRLDNQWLLMCTLSANKLHVHIYVMQATLLPSRIIFPNSNVSLKAK